MKKLFLIMTLLATVSSGFAQEASHRYEIKSGIIHENSTLGGHVTPAIRYFDNYGDNEALVQTIDMGALGSYQNTTVTQKEQAWMYNESGKPKSFDNPLYDLTFINPSQAVIDKYQLVDTGEDEEVAGRMCRKFNYQTTMGRRNKVVYQTSWVYKGVVLKNVMITARQETVTEVTEFQENVEIPAGTFDIPE